MSAVDSGLVFIVGQYKSGSTWLVNLLSLHPQVRGLRETQLFRYAFAEGTPEVRTARLMTEPSWSRGGMAATPRARLTEVLRHFRRGQASLGWRDRPTAVSDLSVADQLRLRRQLTSAADSEVYCRAFYEFLFKALQTPVCLVDKSVTHVRCVDEIKKVFPQSTLVSIHRDGRDVVVSHAHHERNEYRRQEAFAEAVLNWKKAIAQELEAVARHGLISLSYEGLLDDGAGEVGRLLKTLGLAADPEVVADMLNRASFKFVTGRDLGQADDHAFYRRGGSGSWVDELTDSQKAEFCELAGDTLVELGYENDVDWRQWQRPVETRVAAS